MLQRREVDFNMAGQSYRFDRSLINDLSPVILLDSLSVFFMSRDAYELNAWEVLSIYEPVARSAAV